MRLKILFYGFFKKKKKKKHLIVTVIIIFHKVRRADAISNRLKLSTEYRKIKF